MALTPKQAQQPTTPVTFAETVAIVTKAEGAKTGAAFAKWYRAAWKHDPKLTPDQAASAFLLGAALGTSLGRATSFLSGSPYSVTSGGVQVSSGSEGIGVAQAVAKAAESLTGQPDTCCLIKFSGIAGIGSFCVLSKSEARAMIFGLILAASGLITFVGLAVLVAAGFERSGAGEAAGRTLETVGAGVAAVPGGQGAGLAIGSAGAAARRTGRESLDRRRSARAAQQRRTPPRPSTTARPSTTRPPTTTARPSTSAPSTTARKPTEAEIRAQLRARADEISTRQEPGRG